MKKIYQTEFGGHNAPIEKQGNCFQACMASILELPLEEAFDCRSYPDGIWFAKFNEWLEQYGLGCIAIDYTKDKLIPISDIKGYHIMDCMSTTLYNGEHHAVVVKEGFQVHDPNPHATKVGECQGFFLLVLLNPARQIRLPGRV